MARLGISDDVRAQIKSSGTISSRVTVSSPGEYLHRVLGGGYAVYQVWYPTMYFDEESKAWRPSWRSLIIDPDETNVLTLLAAQDKKDLASFMGKADVRSRLDPTRRYWYAIFDQKDTYVYLQKKQQNLLTPEDSLQIQVAEYPFKVSKELVNLEETRDIRNPDKLRYGPIFTFDIIITHEYNANTPGAEFMKHDYRIEVDDAPLKGQLDASILDSNDPLGDLTDDQKAAIFLPEQLELIEEYDFDNLKKAASPMSAKEIAEFLSKNPINLYARSKDGRTPIFANPENLLSTLKEFEIEAIPSDIANPNGTTSTLIPKATEEKNEEEVDDILGF